MSPRRLALALSACLLALAGLVAIATGSSTPGPFNGYLQAVGSDGPVTQYPFEDAAGSGTIADSFGTRNAMNTSIALHGTGPFGGSHAGTFNGSTSFAQMPSTPLASATAFTVEMWANWAGSANNQHIFDLGSSTSKYMYLTPSSSATGNPMRFEIKSKASTFFDVDATTLASGGWHYLVVTEDSGGTVRIYVDGAQVASRSSVTLNPSSLGATSSNLLGKSQTTTDPKFSGSLSNVAFYNRALTAAQVQSHWYAAEIPSSASDPTIAGTAKDGQTLTADKGTWSGLVPITYAYEWRRCNATGGGCSMIAGASASTYTATGADVDSTLRVQVTGTNVAGAATATSPPTTSVSAIQPSSTTAPTVSGVPRDGQTLSASTGSWSGSPVQSYAYRWRRCDTAGANCAEIPSATASTYTLTPGDVGSTVRVQVTATNSGGSGTASSAPTDTVGAVLPVNTAVPTTSGTAKVGHILSGQPGTWTGTSPISYAYQWRRCDTAGANCVPVTSASGPTYTIVEADAGATLRLQVTASNPGGSTPANSAQTGIVISVPPPPQPPAELGLSAGYNLTSHGPAWLFYDADEHWKLAFDNTGEVVTFGSAGQSSAGLTSVSTATFNASSTLASGASSARDVVERQSYEQHGIEKILRQIVSELTSCSAGPGPLSEQQVASMLDDLLSDPTAQTSLWRMVDDYTHTLHDAARAVYGPIGAGATTTYRGIKVVMGQCAQPRYFRFVFGPDITTSPSCCLEYDFFEKGGTTSWYGNGSDSAHVPAPFDSWSPRWGDGQTGSNDKYVFAGTTEITKPWCTHSGAYEPNFPASFKLVRAAQEECHGWPPGTIGDPTQWVGWFEPLAESVDGPLRPMGAGDTASATIYPSFTGAPDLPAFLADPTNGPLITTVINDSGGLPASGPCELCPPSTYGGMDEIHGVVNSGHAAEPVDTATGAYETSVTDLSLPAPGVGFALTRSYTSADTSQHELGQGWSYSTGAYLELKSNGDLLFHSESGQQLLYALASDGTYYGQLASRSKLTKNGSGYRLVRRDQVVYDFDSAGRLLSEVDRNGNGLHLTYTSGKLATVVDAAGHTITFDHNADGTLQKVMLPDGRYVAYGFTAGRLTSVRDVGGGTTTYRYDGNGLLDRIADQNAHTVVRNIYSGGRVSDQYDAYDHHTHFAWDAASRTSTMTDPRGKQWHDVYAYGGTDVSDRVDPLGSYTHVGYDIFGDSADVTDQLGNTTELEYDDNNNLIQRIAPAPSSYTETWVFNNRHDPDFYEDGRGGHTYFGYDGNGNLQTVTQAAGTPEQAITRFDADPATGLLRSTTDPNNKTTTFEYWPDGTPETVTSPLGEKTTYTEDGAGRVATVVDARGNETGANPDDYRTTYQYDDANHVVEVDDPYGHAWTTHYDPAGNLDSRTDPNNHTVSYGYYDDNRLRSVTAPAASSATTYTYDPTGNLATRTDPNGHVAEWLYDDAGRVSQQTIALGTPAQRTTAYTYWPDGALETQTKPGGGVVTYGYDELRRLTAVDYSDSTPDVGYAYDANSNRTQMVDGAGTETYAYDVLDRVKQVARGSTQYGYTYWPGSQVHTRTYPSGSTTTYSYDDDGRLHDATAPGGTTTYGYWADGLLKTTTLPASNGYVESRSWDRAGHLAQIKNATGSSVLSQYDYSYDPAGNPERVDAPYAPDPVRTYGYDTADRLAEVCYQAACTAPTDPYVRYGYDGVGHRTSVKRGTASGEQVETWTYDAADRLSSDGSATYGYDANGNEISDGRGHSYGYDLAGNRTSTTTASGTTTYSYSGAGLLLGQRSAAGSASYGWDENGGLAQLATSTDASGTTESFYGLARISSRVPDGSDVFYHYDAQGSVTGVTGRSGQTQHTYDYDPFGVLRSHTDAPGAAANAFGFAGEPTDPTSGLSYMRARWYEPRTGRFTATDPLAAPPTSPYLSPYVYADGRPTVLRDPSGLVSLPSPGEIGMWVSNQSASALDGLTGGLSTRLAGKILGFNAECASFGSGVATWAGFAGSFFIGVGEERVAAEGVPDALVLVRGGENTPERILGGKGVTTDAAGNVHGVSVNSGSSAEEAAQGIPHRQVGTTTAGDVRRAGGYVKSDPVAGNPGHCLVGGCSADVLSDLLTPTMPNPALK